MSASAAYTNGLVPVKVSNWEAMLSMYGTAIAQERLATLDLENKRAAFDRMTAEYEAAMAKVSGKEGQVDAAQQAANELRAEVNQKVRCSDGAPLASRRI